MRWKGSRVGEFDLTRAEDEVRVTGPTTGGQRGQKPAQLGALAALALLEVGKVAGFGATKYSTFNFVRGYAWRLSLDANVRHLLEFWNGEDRDPEFGLLHTAHAAWHGLTLTTFLLRSRGTDTRISRFLESLDA